MKMVLAIINSDDAPCVIQQLTAKGYPVTKLASSGGFLRVGNVTILMGLDDTEVDPALSIIRAHSSSRHQAVHTSTEMGMGFYPSSTVEVDMGGATVFVLGVERLEKL